jgi:adenine-specific DNA-methyltransferase
VIEGYAYKGKDKSVLFEKKLTTAQILKPSTMEKLSNDVEKLMQSEAENYDKIEKSFKENTLKVEGIKDIKEFKDGLGGGFKYCELGDDIFDEYGELNSSLSYNNIAKHIYFVEFKQPFDKDVIDTPFVGTYQKKELYFFDTRFKITDMKKIVKNINQDTKEIIVYTKKCTISEDTLKKNSISIRYIPYDIKDN